MRHSRLNTFIVAAAVPFAAQAAQTQEVLAKMTQNPIANLISVPLQNNTNFNVGPLSGTQNILNIQPVIPVSLSKDWNLITRTIFPIITQPGFVPDQGSTTGLGDIQFNAFMSPANAAGLIWGAGAIVQAPTHSNDRLGNDRWGLGADRRGPAPAPGRSLGLWRAGHVPEVTPNR